LEHSFEVEQMKKNQSSPREDLFVLMKPLTEKLPATFYNMGSVPAGQFTGKPTFGSKNARQWSKRYMEESER
jgi:hypothetical protein